MRRYIPIHLLSFLLLAVLSACNLTSQAPTAEPLEVPTVDNSGKPVVIISSPETGAQATVNTPVLVSASATDTVGVTRVQLLANGQIVQTRSSEAPSGQTNFQAVLDYTPRQEGNVSLQVIAFRNAIASDPAEVDIVVKATQAQITATFDLSNSGSNNGGVSVPVIDPNDPTCRALTNTALNMRVGPGTNFDKLTVLSPGVVVPIVGRTGDNTWWQVNSGFTVGWVSAQFTSVYGICNAIPIVAPPATATSNIPTIAPTLTPFPTATPKPNPNPAPTATPGKPDLVVASIGGPTSVPASSNAITYSVTITNTGTGPSGSFANKVTVSDGTEKDLGVVSNLNAGESISLNFDLTFSTQGNYTITAVADSNSQVTELYEVNNQSILSVKVT